MRPPDGVKIHQGLKNASSAMVLQCGMGHFQSPPAI